MSANFRVVHKRRATITDLPLYYSGHLLKKNTKDKDFKKYYGELRGATLFLYDDDTQDTYTEKLDLEQLKSMELDSPYQRKVPTIFTLTLHTGEVKLKMDNLDTGEEWKGYILTVIKKEIPSKLQLLPGQILLLKEVLLQEKRRNSAMSRPPLPPRPSFLISASTSPPTSKDKIDRSDPETPSCYFSVTRQEAERMLEANPEYGGIILRPSTLAKNYALTLRQLTPSGPVKKNYRVTSTNSGFVIELETPVMVSSLNDVIKFFIEKTEYRLHPYMPSQPYDTCINVFPTPKCINITSAAPKTVPKAQVAPMPRSQTKEELLPPPTKTEETEYVVPDDHSPGANNLNLVQLDGELREILKLRKETISATDEEEITTYENETTEKSRSSTAQWNINSSTV
ncbi:signal-transducing adaptor protein 1-like isoform X1 [Micropterus salmoides]|uniref:signal-transducing adaptor protein 1-like isoform X1 n=1 Tax=Micropterus salmoides TaxID=27706 RepID=UPI0018EBFBE8|nr:signal-transducing adaptor protein 1-like isoform X1 [Micropterus salmoides]XP_038555011.1 signal-transducing adaptor protein 1-like isoform X1 [Micropterus salmoides]XP_038555012.1 signal-transducing adaptor protein 1-like isoform X1 [Micropterus salmoides]